jgi:hypothetical protein
MRHILLTVAATAVIALIGSAAPLAQRPQPLDTQLFSGFCGNGPGASSWRAGLAAMIASAEAYAQTLPGDINAPPPLVGGLGDAHLDITTSDPMTQEFFDQGLRYLHAFNHSEAVRAFRHARRLDPNCGICAWGESFALGPNINAPMSPEDNEAAYTLARAAHEHRAGASPIEQALIDALQTRYAATAPQDRSALDAGFADAMVAAADAHPDSDILQVFAAEAVMDTQPWDYWLPNGRDPKGRAGDAIGRVETVLARNPGNGGAIHLYIHLVEASGDPWRSEEAAQRLAAIAPQAGHLVHMPGHIYYRVGRFRDSIETNINAVETDERYIRNADPSPIYRYGYYPHNVHFVLTSAAMGGNGQMALDYAQLAAQPSVHRAARTGDAPAHRPEQSYRRHQLVLGRQRARGRAPPADRRPLRSLFADQRLAELGGGHVPAARGIGPVQLRRQPLGHGHRRRRLGHQLQH